VLFVVYSFVYSYLYVIYDVGRYVMIVLLLTSMLVMIYTKRKTVNHA
jgi:hypothetical protein